MKKLFIALVLSAATLSGCSWFHSSKGSAWKAARQENPLQIPPNMDRPDVSDALTIPTVNAQNPQTAAPAADAEPGVLHLAGSVESAYKRVAMALSNGDIGTIASQNDGEHTYKVAMTSKMQIGSSQDFLQRHFSNAQHAPDTATSSQAGDNSAATVMVMVTAAPNGGSNVSASGDPQDVRRLMTALRARLGG